MTPLSMLSFAAIFLSMICGCSGAPTMVKAIPLVPITPMPAAHRGDEPVAPAATGAVGDPAPAISIDHWLKGEPVTSLENGTVHVLEFWATWCGPCISSIPHLSTVQEEHGEAVRIIAISSEKEVDTVRSFMDRSVPDQELTYGQSMHYSVACDPDRSTGNAWMRAFGQRFIPCAFIIDAGGTVAWIGHPSDMDEPLEKIIDGEWDLAAAREEFLER